jgi:hypothetical protein
LSEVEVTVELIQITMVMNVNMIIVNTIIIMMMILIPLMMMVMNDDDDDDGDDYDDGDDDYDDDIYTIQIRLHFYLSSAFSISCTNSISTFII